MSRRRATVALCVVGAVLLAGWVALRRLADPVARGEALQARGDLPGAQALWDKACLDEPGNPAACVSSGASRLYGGDPDRAEPFAQRAERLSPKDLRVLLLRAGIDQAEGRIEQARSGYRRAAEENPRSGLPAANLGMLALEEGNVREADNQATQALSLQPDLPLALSLRARVLAANQELQPAAEILRKLASRGAATVDDRATLADLLGQMGDLPGRIAALEGALRIRPDDARLLTAYGESLSQAGRLEEAVDALREAAERAPRQTEPERMLGEVYLREGRYDFAEARFRAALAISSNDALSRFDLANSHAWALRYPEAIADLDPLLARPGLPPELRLRALHARALCRVRQRKELDLAMADLESIFSLDRNNVPAHWMKGHLLLEEGRAAEARSELEKATAVDPAAPEALLDHARALAKEGRHREAVAELIRLAREGAFQPDQVRAQAELSVLAGDRSYELLLAGADPTALVLDSAAAPARALPPERPRPR